MFHFWNSNRYACKVLDRIPHRHSDPASMSLLPVRLDPPGLLTSLLRGGGRSFTFPHQPIPKFGISITRFPRIEAKGIPRKDNAKIRNRRLQKKFNGSATKPRLSVFCSNKQLYAMLVDDHNKKTLFYASTLQKSFSGDPSRTTSEAAQKVGEELVKACMEMNICEISSYDRNGFARGERMTAFEIAISEHGLLPH